MKNHIILVIIAFILVGCGANANLAFSTSNGSCAAFGVESTTVQESAPAPYCMQVTITNNGTGQNWINSSTASVANISMTITGATNINSPATAPTTMDPNNCRGSTISPGGECAFYLQISQESYPVDQAETINLTLTYDVNNTLFGGSNATGTSSFNLYEITNLYMPEANGNLAILNSSSTPFTTNTALSSGGIISASIDNSVYGYLYISGGNGIYQYGEESTTPSISPAGFTGASNLINSNGNIYAAAMNNTGTYQWTLSSNSWSNNSASVFSLTAALNNNVNTVSPSGVLYLSTKGASNAVYSCTSSGSSGSATPCVQDSVSLNEPITTMSYISTSIATNTGLYAGTNQHLYAETKGAASTLNKWENIKGPDGSDIQGQMNTMTTDADGNLYVGDNSGTIWLITSSSSTNQASKLYALSSGGIQAMKIDTVANTLYFVTTNGQLYSCGLGNLGTAPSCLPSVVPGTQTLSSSVVSMQIASQLSNSL